MRPDNVALRLPDSLDADVELMSAEPATPRGARGPAVGPLGWSVPARGLLDGLVALLPAGPRRWRRASSSRPRCCATCRRPAAARRAPARATGPVRSCAPPMTSGTRVPGDTAGVEPRRLSRSVGRPLTWPHARHLPGAHHRGVARTVFDAINSAAGNRSFWTDQTEYEPVEGSVAVFSLAPVARRDSASRSTRSTGLARSRGAVWAVRPSGSPPPSYGR